MSTQNKLIFKDWFERGSEWRLWDLHLHTPTSYDYGNKSITNKDIIDNLKKNNISAAVITDHSCIDVNRVEELIELGKRKNILILPGIEFTSELGGKSSVHFIGIFDNKNISKIWDSLKVKLELMDIDFSNNESIKSSYQNLKNASKIIHDLGGIVSIHAGHKSNSIENIGNNTLDKMKLKNDLLNEYVDILEVNKPNECEDYFRIVFQKINKKLPMIICSDNHNINNFKSDYKYNCWIKSDLTFEGLKQILYEPEERVRISESKPDEKNNYEVIESITFQDTNFQKNEIKLNSNLVSIIGSRSSGKSTLLRSIANAANYSESYEINFGWDNLINPNCIIKWKTNELNEFINGKNNDSKIKLKYIPQGFLNSKAEDIENFVNELINNILKKNENYQLTYENIDKLTNRYKEYIFKSLTEIFKLDLKITEYINNINELGNETDIQNQINILESEYDKINKNKNSDKEYNHKFLELEELNSKIKNEILEKETQLKILEELQLEIKNNKIDLEYYNINQLPLNILNEINETLNVSNIIFQKLLNEIIDKHIYIYKNDLNNLEYEANTNYEELTEIKEKIESFSRIKELSEKINIEKIRLDELNNTKRKLTDLKERYDKKTSEIFEVNRKFLTDMKNIIENFNLEEEFEIFSPRLFFNVNKFKEEISRILNNKKFFKFKNDYSIDLENFENFNYAKDLEIIIKSILDNTLTLKKDYSKKEALNILLNPFHALKFDVIYEGDTLGSMSPGKRSFIILKILIQLDNTKWPILIDQPEDDLDAKSISKELASFLKETKKHRQIIIVTHNPNLVVGADSEQIIVANQNGVDLKNKKTKFEYISGSIENTYINSEENTYLYSKGIKEHICDILEGGEESFKKRQNKYDI